MISELKNDLPETMTKRLIVAIHGVGDSSPGVMTRLLRKTLEQFYLNLTIKELNWNEWVEKPLEYKVVKYVMGLSSAIMEAICLPVVPRHRDLSIWSEKVGRFVEYIAPLNALMVSFPLYFLLMVAWGCASLNAITIIGGILLMLFSFVAMLGALSLNSEIFWGSIRVGLLPCLWSPLGLIMVLSSIPWPIVIAMLAYIGIYAWIASLVYPGLKLWAIFGNSGYVPMANPSWWFKYGVGLLLALGIGPLISLADEAWSGLYNASIMKGVTKVLGDIFFYLGSPTYRTRLVGASTKKIEGLLTADVEELILCAHSLGTVVAVDMLSRMQNSHPPHVITLVSAGSPLYRLFWRFFPALFPPPREIAKVLHHKHNGFRWVNVFRRFDYIGGSLCLSPFGIDVCTRQWWPMHINYWGDRFPFLKVMEVLPIASVLTIDNEHNPGNPPVASKTSSSLKFLHRWAVCLVMIVIVLLPARILLAMYRTNSIHLSEVAEYAASSKQPTTVKVRYFPKAYKGGWFARPLGLAINIQILDRGLKDNLANNFLVNTGALAKIVERYGRKSDSKGVNPFIELEIKGMEAVSKPHLFTISNLPPPKTGIIIIFCYFTSCILMLLIGVKGWRQLRFLVEYFMPSIEEITGWIDKIEVE